MDAGGNSLPEAVLTLRRRDFDLGAFSQHRIHPTRRLPLQARNHVAVSVQRQADLRVPEDFHHDARVHALRE